MMHGQKNIKFSKSMFCALFLFCVFKPDTNFMKRASTRISFRSV